MDVFSAADADKIRRFEQVQTAADSTSAHSHFSLKQIRRNLRRPSQKLRLCCGVTVKQQPHKNGVKVGEQQEAEIDFYSFKQTISCSCMRSLFLILTEMITDVPTIWI